MEHLEDSLPNLESNDSTIDTASSENAKPLPQIENKFIVQEVTDKKSFGKLNVMFEDHNGFVTGASLFNSMTEDTNNHFTFKDEIPGDTVWGDAEDREYEVFFDNESDLTILLEIFNGNQKPTVEDPIGYKTFCTYTKPGFRGGEVYHLRFNKKLSTVNDYLNNCPFSLHQIVLMKAEDKYFFAYSKDFKRDFKNRVSNYTKTDTSIGVFHRLQTGNYGNYYSSSAAEACVRAIAQRSPELKNKQIDFKKIFNHHDFVAYLMDRYIIVPEYEKRFTDFLNFSLEVWEKNGIMPMFSEPEVQMDNSVLFALEQLNYGLSFQELDDECSRTSSKIYPDAVDYTAAGNTYKKLKFLQFLDEHKDELSESTISNSFSFLSTSGFLSESYIGFSYCSKCFGKVNFDCSCQAKKGNRDEILATYNQLVHEQQLSVNLDNDLDIVLRALSLKEDKEYWEQSLDFFYESAVNPELKIHPNYLEWIEMLEIGLFTPSTPPLMLLNIMTET